MEEKKKVSFRHSSPLFPASLSALSCLLFTPFVLGISPSGLLFLARNSFKNSHPTEAFPVLMAETLSGSMLFLWKGTSTLGRAIILNLYWLTSWGGGGVPIERGDSPPRGADSLPGALSDPKELFLRMEFQMG